jgi:probable rRNA maturation factor
MNLKKLEELAEAVFSELGEEGAILDIYLVPDRMMRKINRDFRGKDRPTTVLSFAPAPGPRPDGTASFFGEIYLAPEFIKSHNESIGRLLVHGILHLCGFGHESRKERARMEKQEEKLEKTFSSRRGFRPLFN